ncbi:type 2 DNA topoisomerase 6 subunit B-like [Pseudonaja textilis]|uniref:type 2 DNA topoisomerase 6 subunit B-like n=1 Tax=Pseudonaja textilis TaxID=8673 RepID=UPI000EA998F6|nr:type 2 DNA topoisomerase 6 subunit B-like [Pseudonaja textilis]
MKKKVLEFLIIQLQGEQSERSSMLEGTIVISLNIQDSPQRVNQSYCAAIIAAKGDLCHKLLNDLTFRGKYFNLISDFKIESVLPFCQRGVLHGSGCSHESLPTMPFQLSFQLYEKSEVLKEDSIALKQFVHRISLVHTTITFHYCVKVNGNISAETYRSEFRAVVPSCDKIHLVTGERVNLFIPDELVERGFTGALSLTPAASLCPCQKSFPNQPAKIIAASPTIYIFLYDPVGLPILFSAEEVSYSFFEDPSRLASWGKYAYQATPNSAACCKTDTARPEIQFNLQTSDQQDSEIQEQTLLLFLFLGYTDPFQDKPIFTFWNRRMILSHLSPILFCSEQAVKRATQELVNDVLHQHYRLFQEQQKLACSLPIMASAISRIVSSSTDGDFRRKCLHTLQVADTQEFQETIRETFNKVILKQWKPSNACEIKKPLPRKCKTRPLTAKIPSSSIHQKTSCSFVSCSGLEPEEGTSEREGFRFDSSEFDKISTTKKRKPANRRIPTEEDSEDLNLSGEAKNKEPKGSLPRRPEATSTSAFSSSSKSERDIFPDKSQGDDGVTGAARSKSLCQEEDFWAQEVFNMGQWTS